MFRPLTCYIGLRYLRPARRRGLVSFMSFASLAGIALGVAALIIILSVMNGFELELRNRLLSMSEHVSISASDGALENPAELAERIAGVPGVAASAPHVSLEGMLVAGSEMRPALIRGIDPAQERAISDVAEFMQRGSLDALEPGANRIVLGRFLALRLGVAPGDRLRMLVPRVVDGRPRPEYAGVTVAGVFEAGITDHDSRLALVELGEAAALAGLAGRGETMAVRVTDPMQAPEVRAAIERELGAGFEYTDWTVQHASLFQAVRIEKTMMAIMLMFVVAVAAFNIVASLMMVVTDKQRDIAILRTFGLEPRRVSRIFFVQGAVIGVAGTLTGTALGLVGTLNIDTVVPWLERTFGFQLMPGDVYYLTRIPWDIELADVTTIPLLALGIAVLATLYPSRRAARIPPAQALRYD